MSHWKEASIKLTSSRPISSASRETTSTAVTATSLRCSSVFFPPDKLVCRVPVSPTPRNSPPCDRVEAARPPAIVVPVPWDRVFSSEYSVEEMRSSFGDACMQMARHLDAAATAGGTSWLQYAISPSKAGRGDMSRRRMWFDMPGPREASF